MREAREIVQHSCIDKHLVWDYTLHCLNSVSTEISESFLQHKQSCVSAHSLMILLFKLGDSHCTHHVFIFNLHFNPGKKPTRTQGNSIKNTWHLLKLLDSNLAFSNLGFSPEHNAVFHCPKLFAAGGWYCANANQAECLKSKGRLHHCTLCNRPQNAQGCLLWGWWY